MSCEYCDIKSYSGTRNKIKVLCWSSGYYTSLYMTYDCKDKIFGLMANGEGDGDSKAEIKINYCPICGRRLS